MLSFASYRQRVEHALRSVDTDRFSEFAKWLSEARASGRQIFVCGNGGSAATSSHFATDLGKGASFGFPVQFRVTSLTDNLPLISAYANDLGYERVFAEQLRTQASAGDVLVVISGSGNSPNILGALEIARELGLRTVALTGFQGGEAAKLADLSLNVASDHMGVIEDVHMSICHAISFGFIESWRHETS